MADNFRWITTLIPDGHKFVDNDYVHGRISAVLKIFCSPYKPIHMGWLKRYSQPDHNFGYFFEVWTTDAAYEGAMKYLELLYPGVCQYDVPHDPDQCCFAEDEIAKDALCLGRYG